MSKTSEFKIKSLILKKYHYQNLNLDFSDTANGPIYFIGGNGSYKSSMLEIVFIIFASFDAPSVIGQYKFDYSLEYSIDGKEVLIKKVGDKYSLVVETANEPNIGINSKTLDTVREKLRMYNLLPSRIVTLYSGENDRLRGISAVATRGYYSIFYKQIADWAKGGYKEKFSFASKRYVHGNNELIPIFLAMSMQEKNSRKLLRKYCNIEALRKISFDIRRDSRGKEIQSSTINEKTLVKNLAAQIDEKISSNLQIKNLGDGNYTMDLFLNVHSFKPELLFNFFEAVTTLFTVSITTYFKMGKVHLPDTALSQGQRQWAKIIGLMVLANTANTLVLMDEPDAFMNPVWKYDFNNALNSISNSYVAKNRTCLVVTHDPMLINGVPKEQVRVFNKNEDQINIEIPANDTYGLGIDGILRSPYYGLTTTYDSVTTEKYYRRMELYAKALNNELRGKSERRELFELTKELGSLPAFSSSIDYLYLDFLKAYKESPYAEKQYLSEKDVKNKEAILSDIIKSLFAEHEK